MRWISLLLATYFMSLSFLSCADTVTQSIASMQQEVNISSATHECHHESEASDDCSPFCSCQCCQTNTTNSSFNESVYINSTIGINSIYIVSSQGVEYFDFFVPPRQS